MAGRIPEDFIESLLERTDIVDVISNRVPLQRAGREYKACCPFHDEKTPSFYVSPQKQFYHCFGCGVHGTAIGFVMQYDGLEFPDAIESLAADAGLEVPREGGSGAPPARFDGMLAALGAADDWFRGQLQQSRAALDYLERRGLDAAVIEEFGVGYAPDRWDALLGHLSSRDVSRQDMERAGLIAAREDGRRYDRFRHRIMFPIHDRRGRVVAFGGRALAAEKGPKYLNSPETPLFHKGKELYRLFQARRGARPDRLMVVEGYMDALALHQFGFPGAVATLGTAVTSDQVRMLFRASPEVVFCFDGDRAGRQAAWRGLEAALPVLEAGHQVRFLFLPEGEDPDSVVRARGAAGMQRELDKAQPLPDFFFQDLTARVDMESLDGRARLVALAEPYLERLPAGPLAELMRGELARRTGYRGRSSPPAPEPKTMQPGRDRMSLMRHAIALLVQYPGLARQVDPSDLGIPGEIKGIGLLRELIDFCRQKPHLSTAVLLERWRGRPEAPHLAKLAAKSLPGDEDSRERELIDIVTRIRKQLIEARFRAMQQIQAVRRLTEQENLEWRHIHQLLAESKTKHLES